jgi:hypothetical protein
MQPSKTVPSLSLPSMRSLPSVCPAGAGLLQEIDPEVYAATGAPQVNDPPPSAFVTVDVTVEVHDWVVTATMVVTVVMTAGCDVSASGSFVGRNHLQECPGLKLRLLLQ